MAHLYQLSGPGNRIRAIAYQNVSKVLSGLEKDVAGYAANDSLESVEGIGESIATKIREFLKTGKIRKYEAMKGKFPGGLLELMVVRGIGPQTIKKLHREFQVNDKAGLIRSGKSSDKKSKTCLNQLYL